MELFTVSMMTASEETLKQLLHCIEKQFTDLHSDHTVMGRFRFETNAETREIRCFADLNYFRLAEHGEIVYHRAANAFADYIVSEMEPLLLRAIIRKQFNYEEQQEAEEIERYCHTLLHDPAATPEDKLAEDTLALDTERRKMKVANELEVFLHQYTRIHLDGFATFRLTSYWEELREVVAYAVDEYVMDKQYQEFITLLKYFVKMQEVKVPIVNVLHKQNNEFELYDEHFQMLKTEPADRIVVDMLESEMNMEDMIVSTLITVSPSRIVIHTQQPELTVIRTLETIFEQRVQLCAACSQSKPCFEEAAQAVSLPGHSAKSVTMRQIQT
ncbi:sporulation protein YtxC [Paenibacillus sp. GCM10027626]|uniref:sporulation protein YtxC n=1 Tax=Paenibacillus sp. GCM10027626 TaxID=3273411 RepID=UPI0036380D12